jgi:hypothetical protein
VAGGGEEADVGAFEEAGRARKLARAMEHVLQSRPTSEGLTMATSIRLSVEVEHLIARIARRRKQSKSEVIRSALSALEEVRDRPGHGGPYESMKHLIGIVDSGGLSLSQQTGRKFRELLIRRAHGRRAR